MAQNWLLLRHQPLKFLYLSYVVASLLFVKLPLWTVYCLLPALRPRPSWPLARALLVWSLREIVIAVFNTASFKSARTDPRVPQKQSAQELGLVWIDATPELVVGEVKRFADIDRVKAERVAGYWFGKRDEKNGVGQTAEADEKVILNFHSGGWVIGDATPGGPGAILCNRLPATSPDFKRLFSVEYRLSQGPPLPIEDPFPAALFDAVAAYAYLVKTLGFRPHDILITGDSAGGALAIMLVRYLALSNLSGLPVPGGLFIASPSGDWGISHFGEGSSYSRHGNSDWVHGFNRGYCRRALLGYLPESEADMNAWISPSSKLLPNVDVEGLFRGFPPTLLQVGDVEMTLDQVQTMRDRLKKDIGEKLRYVEVKDGTHVLLNLPWHAEEKARTYKEVKQWIKETFD